jgi:oligoribonuclease NrnB/cAMP/cGMP phosphodiesterase (DHH superfamily)
MKHHIYHHNDMDGHASGAITAFGLEATGVRSEDIVFYRINYGQPFDDTQVDYENDKIYVVDFSLQPYDRMAELTKKADLVWIDHHVTSYNWIQENYKNGKVPWEGKVLEGPRAACELCWEHFFVSPVPEIVKRISQYDVWNKDYPHFDWKDEQIPLQMYFRNMETRPAKNMEWWRQQLSMGNNAPDDGAKAIQNMIQQGKVLQDYNDKQLRSLTLENGFKADLCGNKVFALNTPQSGSRQFEVAIDMTEYDMVCAFRLYKAEYWVVSLYSIKEGVNCGELAKRLGAKGPCNSGGGHAGAAGFQTSYEHLMSVLRPLPKEE